MDGEMGGCLVEKRYQDWFVVAGGDFSPLEGVCSAVL